MNSEIANIIEVKSAEAIFAISFFNCENSQLTLTAWEFKNVKIKISPGWLKENIFF
jgi:hypothetical protein